MGRMDDLKKVKDGVAAKLAQANLGKVAGDAVVSASEFLDGVESVAKRSGLTDKEGKISKRKVAWAVVARRKRTARALLRATSEELQARRGNDDAGPQAAE